LRDFAAHDAKQASLLRVETPDPELPVRATSAITVLNLELQPKSLGVMMWERTAPSGTT